LAETYNVLYLLRLLVFTPMRNELSPGQPKRLAPKLPQYTYDYCQLMTVHECVPGNWHWWIVYTIYGQFSRINCRMADFFFAGQSQRCTIEQIWHGEWWTA